MVKFLTQSNTYDYCFPTVTLAYFLRYPNPFSTHVISTDVIERSFDAATQRLSTTRLHLKRSKMPGAILRLLPRSLLGASNTGESQSYVLERSTVDVREGWMMTESRNLEMTNLLSVVERQEYRATQDGSPLEPSAIASSLPVEQLRFGTDSSTRVSTTVQFTSKFGQRLRERRRAAEPSSSEDDEEAPRQGFLARWGQSSLQRSIEAIGLKRAHRSQTNAFEGMKVVLDRMREGGVVAVLEGMRRDREQAMAVTKA